MSKRIMFVAAVLWAPWLAASPAVAQVDGQRRAQEAVRAQGQGNLDQALTLFSEALQDSKLSNDRRAVILTDRGALLARLNQPKAAIDDFNRAVQLYPEHAAIYNNRGSTLLTLGHTPEAIKDFDRALLLAPGYGAAYNNRAGAHMQMRQHDKAIRDYTKAIELAPTAIAPLNGRGRAQLANDRPQAASRDFSRALAVDSRFSLGYRNRAEAKLRSERYGEAVEDLSRAIAFDPTNWDLYVTRGNAYMASANIAAAIRDYSRALELQPRATPALEARALAHVKLEAHDEAEADILRALEVDPRSATGIAARAVLYLRTGQIELARREIDKAVRLEPDRPEVLWAKGETEEAVGRREEAVGSYRAALAARPFMKEAADGLERLGAAADTNAESELRGLGVDNWTILRRGQNLLAASREFPRLRIPIEMAGEGLPRLISWEIKKPPYRDIALLQFSTGQITAPGGVEETEQIAIVNIPTASLIGIVPQRRGQKRAIWTWDENKVTVAAVDGLTDEFTLKGNRAIVDPNAVAAAQAKRQADGARQSYAPPNWLPWDTGPQQQRRTSSSSRPQKPKTLIDILFGN